MLFTILGNERIHLKKASELRTVIPISLRMVLLHSPVPDRL